MTTETNKKPSTRLDLAVPQGIPLSDYELAFGWIGYGCPVRLDKKGNYKCRECNHAYKERDDEGEIMDEPLDIRHEHQLQCKSYEKWRLTRWRSFNRSTLGDCTNLFFRQHMVQFLNITCDDAMKETLVNMFESKVTKTPPVDSTSSTSKQEAE
jgi:hypothetical protein